MGDIIRTDIKYTVKYHKFNINKLRAFERDSYICQVCGKKVEDEIYYEYGCKLLPNLKYDQTKLDRHPPECPLIKNRVVETKIVSKKYRNKVRNYRIPVLSCYEYNKSGICNNFTDEIKTRPDLSKILAHHKDGNKQNNNLWNLLTVHKRKCHKIIEDELKKYKEAKYMFGNNNEKVDRVEAVEADIAILKEKLDTILSLLNKEGTFDIDIIASSISNNGIIDDDASRMLYEKTSYKFPLMKNTVNDMEKKLKTKNIWATYLLDYTLSTICTENKEPFSHADGYKKYLQFKKFIVRDGQSFYKVK